MKAQIALATLLIVFSSANAVQAAPLSWGDVIKWLSPKRIAGGSRSPLCLPNSSVSLTVRPTVLWQGQIGAIGLRRSQGEKVFWLQKVPAGADLQQLRYSGKALEPGQSYDWVFFDDPQGENPLTWQTFTTATRQEQTLARLDLAKLPGSGEAKLINRINYLVQQQMVGDAVSEMLAVRSRSPELQATLNQLGNSCKD